MPFQQGTYPKVRYFWLVLHSLGMKCMSFRAATVTTFMVLALAARDDSRLCMTLQHTVHCSVHDKLDF